MSSGALADAHYAKTHCYELDGLNGEERRKPGRTALLSLRRRSAEFDMTSDNDNPQLAPEH